MRANIVTKAVHNERGQVGEKKSGKWKGDTLLALLEEHVCTGRHSVWEKTLENGISSGRGGLLRTNVLDQRKEDWQINNLFSNLKRRRAGHALKKHPREKEQINITSVHNQSWSVPFNEERIQGNYCSSWICYTVKFTTNMKLYKSSVLQYRSTMKDILLCKNVYCTILTWKDKGTHSASRVLNVYSGLKNGLISM